MYRFAQALQSFLDALSNFMSRGGLEPGTISVMPTRVCLLVVRRAPWRDDSSCRVRSVEAAGRMMDAMLHVCGCFDGDRTGKRW